MITVVVVPRPMPKITTARFAAARLRSTRMTGFWCVAIPALAVQPLLASWAAAPLAGSRRRVAGDALSAHVTAAAIHVARMSCSARARRSVRWRICRARLWAACRASRELTICLTRQRATSGVARTARHRALRTIVAFARRTIARVFCAARHDGALAAGRECPLCDRC